MTLSYFTGEQHSENFEQIINLAEKLGFSVRVYESKESNQFDFMQAVYRDAATIVDATISDDITLSTVYPLLTAHINILDHILVFSDKFYEDGSEVLPLNITPKRTRNRNEDLREWLEKQLVELKDESLFDRFKIESPDVVVNYMKRMEEAIVKSLEKYEQKRDGKTRVMISYRNSCSEEVERFSKEEEAKEKVEIKVLPPGSLCGDSPSEKTDFQSANSAQELPSKCKNCTLEEIAVLRIIQQNPSATQKYIAFEIGKSERTVKSITSRLAEQGILKRVNGKRNGYWEIVDDL